MGLTFLFFINMLPSAFLFPRTRVDHRGRATFVAIYNLPQGNRLEVIDDIAAMLELHNLFPTPRQPHTDIWRVYGENRAVSPSPPVEEEANISSPTASPEMNRCDSFDYCPVINDLFPNDPPTPNLEINEVDEDRKKGIFYISPWLADQTKSQKGLPIPSEDTIWEAFKEMCRKYKM
jgi:hypothetical protein